MPPTKAKDALQFILQPTLQLTLQPTLQLILQPTLNHKNLKNKTHQQHFESWQNKCVAFAPLNTISLQEVYENYCKFVNLRYQSVPLSKKVFSINLRFTFEKETQDKKLVFFTRSRVFIKGIQVGAAKMRGQPGPSFLSSQISISFEPLLQDSLEVETVANFTAKILQPTAHELLLVEI